MYTQIAGMTVVAYLVKLIPNVEGFVILLTQTITVLYMIYYILMFTAFLRLRYDQPTVLVHLKFLVVSSVLGLLQV